MNQVKKKLVLSAETIRVLKSDELGGVAGGGRVTTVIVNVSQESGCYQSTCPWPPD